jgi:methionyl-tRNA formyltransferase
LAASPVKEKALEWGLPLAQPEKLRTPEFHDLIAAQRADLLVVVAFRILPASLFPLAKHGAVNLHGSLLPKYRGAAPIQWAVAEGETETGVTLFQLDDQVDHGRILLQERTSIGPDETSGELFNRLSHMGEKALVQAVAMLESGNVSALDQNHDLATPAPKLSKEDGRIRPEWTAQQLHNRVRAFNPYPICWVEVEGGKPLRLWRTRMPEGEEGVTCKQPMTWVKEGRRLFLGAADGPIEVLEIQGEGQAKQSAEAFLNGLRGGDLPVLKMNSPEPSGQPSIPR